MEYEPMPRKSKLPEIMKFYANEVDHILTYKPRNTGANLAREIVAYNNQYNHKDGTAMNYIRPYLKKNYTVSNKEWCRIDYSTYTYDKITDEQLKFLKGQFKIYLDSESVADTIADAEAGYMNEKEAYGLLKSNFNTAIQEFKKVYGFRPYKAGELIKNAWVIEDEDAAKNKEIDA